MLFTYFCPAVLHMHFSFFLVWIFVIETIHLQIEFLGLGEISLKWTHTKKNISPHKHNMFCRSVHLSSFMVFHSHETGDAWLNNHLLWKHQLNIYFEIKLFFNELAIGKWQHSLCYEIESTVVERTFVVQPIDAILTTFQLLQSVF